MKIKNINYTYSEDEDYFIRYLANINLIDDNGNNIMVNAIIAEVVFTGNLELVEIISSSKDVNFSELYSLIACEQIKVMK